MFLLYLLQATMMWQGQSPIPCKTIGAIRQNEASSRLKTPCLMEISASVQKHQACRTLWPPYTLYPKTHVHTQLDWRRTQLTHSISSYRNWTLWCSEAETRHAIDSISIGWLLSSLIWIHFEDTDLALTENVNTKQNVYFVAGAWWVFRLFSAAQGLTAERPARGWPKTTKGARKPTKAEDTAMKNAFHSPLTKSSDL